MEMRRRELGEAEPLYLEALRGRRETLGDTHRDTLESINNLAWFLHSLPGRAGEAVVLARQAVAGYKRCEMSHTEAMGRTLDTLACALEAAGDREEAAAVRARIAGAE